MDTAPTGFSDPYIKISMMDARANALGVPARTSTIKKTVVQHSHLWVGHLSLKKFNHSLTQSGKTTLFGMLSYSSH